MRSVFFVRNTFLGNLIFLCTLLVLASCTVTDLPPDPQSPDSGPLAGRAYAVGGVCYTEQQLQNIFSPAETVTFSHPITGGSNLQIDVSGEDFIFKQGYVLKNCEQWEPLEYQPTADSRVKRTWLSVVDSAQTGATVTIPIDETFSTEGHQYVLVYACSKVDSQWNCHDNKWMVAEFQVQPASCADGVHNQDESDVDCGGSCGATCSEGQACIVGEDCVSGECQENICQVAVDELPPPPACVPGEEFCDGLDNDCDGAVDNGFADIVEVCDLQDNNCNGQVDEGFDVQSDVNHCGQCGVACEAGQVCREGTCQPPPAVEVTQCQDLENEGTTYILVNDVTTDELNNCFTTFAPHITFDCNGHAISGSGRNGVNPRGSTGISVSGVTRGEITTLSHNIMVKNCEISGFGYGMSVGRDIQNARIEENTLHDNKYGIALQPESSGAIIANNHLLRNDQGIVLYTSLSNTISQNSICETYQSVRCVSPEIAISGDGNVFDGMLNPCPASWPQEGVHYSLCPGS